jgi:hypothetical protein
MACMMERLWFYKRETKFPKMVSKDNYQGSISHYSYVMLMILSYISPRVVNIRYRVVVCEKESQTWMLSRAP